MKIRVDYSICDDFIDGAIMGALKADAMRWCSSWSAEEGAKLLITRVNDEEHRLTREKIEKGLLVLARRYPYHFNDLIRPGGKSKTSIVGSADLLIQCALFGKERPL